MSKLRSVVITGANRGIGLSLVKNIVPRFNPTKIFATYRDPAKSKELIDFASSNPSVQCIQLDMRDFDKYEDIAKTVQSSLDSDGLNLLINNAGITSKVAKLSATRKAELMDNLETNTVGPIMFTKALLPLLEKACTVNPDAAPGIGRAVVLNVSSILGSIAENAQGGMYAYRCSKSAINAATKSMSVDFKRSKIIAVALHPGWIQTDMGGPKAPLTIDQAVPQIVSLIENLNWKHNGRFLQYDGKELAW